MSPATQPLARKRATGDTNHCVIGNNRFQCLHCGDENILKLPIGLKDFAAACRSFTERHKSCKKVAS